MIVVAASALFCAALARIWIPCVLVAFDRLEARGMPTWEGSLTPIGPLAFASVAWSFVQASRMIWFLAFAAFRLRKPRPPLRIVALQPGMVAL
jgi:hypothetical protein